MPPRREVPPMVRNCVETVAQKLAEKHRGPVTREDISRAFAICIASGRKSGQLTKEGPLRMTPKGAALSKGHKAKATPERVERYEELLASVRSGKRRVKKNSSGSSDLAMRRSVMEAALAAIEARPSQKSNIDAFIRVHLLRDGDKSLATRQYAKDQGISVNTAEQRVHRGAQAVAGLVEDTSIASWILSRDGAKKSAVRSMKPSRHHLSKPAAEARRSILEAVADSISRHEESVRKSSPSRKDTRRYLLDQIERGMIAYCDVTIQKGM